MDICLPRMVTLPRTTVHGTPTRYDPVARLLHWIFAVGIVYATLVGYGLGWIADKPLHDFLANLNMSLATVLMALFPVRVVWRFLRVDPAPPAIGPKQRLLAHSVQTLLYVTMFAVLFSGYLMVPHSYRLFGLVTVPTPFEKGAATDLFFTAHHITCACLAGLLGLHLLGVIKHTIITPIGLLRRML